MGSIKALVLLAFSGCIGLTFLVLGCAIEAFGGQWWPLFVIVFYVLCPLPLVIAGKYQDDMAASSAAMEFALFCTTGIVLSAFALPVVLAHAAAISVGACLLAFAANIINFLTILAYFHIFREEPSLYSLW